MAQKQKIIPLEKTDLHPRNKHRSQYNFLALCECLPELSAFVKTNPHKNKSIDFSNAAAVKTLNKALLKYYYKITYWDIPENYLCPPIPGRADYIHYIADLLAESNDGNLPNGELIKILDIGVGANCVYPIIGTSEYQWNFIGSDIDPIALSSSKKIITSTNQLENKITLRLQENSNNILKDVLKPNEYIDITICNPPFHSSLEEAQLGTNRKWKNLGLKKGKENSLNFGGQPNELWCDGGENAFLCKMVEQSASISSQCFWFSTLVSKKTTLPSIYYLLEKTKAIEVKTIEMTQGQKTSRIVAWTYLTKEQQQNWKTNRWK